MVELFWIPLVLQAVVPIGLLLWLAFARQPSHAAWVLTVVLVAFYIRLMAAAGLWLILPAVLLPVYGASLVAGAAVSLWRVRSPAERPRGARAAVGLALRAATVALVAALGVHANGGRRAPGPAVDLAFPLRHGTYLVVNGGSVELINAHIMTLTKDRFQAYRGQSYGVDLVRVSDRGVRARGLLPQDPAAYGIFGDTVVAPCPGAVVAAEDGHPDMPPPQADRAHMAGNHVILQCADMWIVLGHFQRGSVRVARGDVVGTGEAVGLVGNSGNTNEPHLHIHAQWPGRGDTPLSGDPIPIRLDGRYVVRNDRITGREQNLENP